MIWHKIMQRMELDLVSQGKKHFTYHIRRCKFNPGLGKSPGGGHGNSRQYSCLENPMDRGPWRAVVHGTTKSWTLPKQLSMHAHTWLMLRKKNENTFVYLFLMRVGYHWLGFEQLAKNSVSLSSGIKQGDWYLMERKSMDGMEESFLNSFKHCPKSCQWFEKYFWFI